VQADEVSLRLANSGAGIEPLSQRLWPAGGGYVARQPLPPIPGRWSLRVDARIGDFDKLIFETEAVTR
jgi:copper transport protein